MAFYKHQYLHQTVEHCLKEPRPSNVTAIYTTPNSIVYAVDLPASVWMAVRVSKHDIYDNSLHPFASPSLRKEWIDNYIESQRVTVP